MVGDPWCYQNTPNKCDKLNFKGEQPGYDKSWYEGMYKNFNEQIGVSGTGAVEASPDHGTAGGDYFFDWMRDGSLTMRTYIELNNGDYSAIKDKMSKYLDWVQILQSRKDPFD